MLGLTFLEAASRGSLFDTEGDMAHAGTCLGLERHSEFTLTELIMHKLSSGVERAELDSTCWLLLDGDRTGLGGIAGALSLSAGEVTTTAGLGLKIAPGVLGEVGEWVVTTRWEKWVLFGGGGGGSFFFVTVACCFAIFSGVRIGVIASCSSLLKSSRRAALLFWLILSTFWVFLRV